MKITSFFIFSIVIFISCSPSKQVASSKQFLYKAYLDINSFTESTFQKISNNNLFVFVITGNDTAEVKKIDSIYAVSINDKSSLLLKLKSNLFAIDNIIEKFSFAKVAEINIYSPDSNVNCYKLSSRKGDVFTNFKTNECLSSYANFIYINNIDINYSTESKIFSSANHKINYMLNKYGYPNIGKP